MVRHSSLVSLDDRIASIQEYDVRNKFGEWSWDTSPIRPEAVIRFVHCLCEDQSTATSQPEGCSDLRVMSTSFELCWMKRQWRVCCRFVRCGRG